MQYKFLPLFRESLTNKNDKKLFELEPDEEEDDKEFEVQLSEEQINEIKELAKQMAKYYILFLNNIFITHLF